MHRLIESAVALLAGAVISTVLILDAEQYQPAATPVYGIVCADGSVPQVVPINVAPTVTPTATPTRTPTVTATATATATRTPTPPPSTPTPIIQEGITAYLVLHNASASSVRVRDC